MGKLINEDLVNKVRETSKNIYNRIPDRQNSFWTRKKIFIGICVVLCLFVFGLFGGKESQSGSSTSVESVNDSDLLKISVSDLLQEYKNNEKSFNKKYKDKVFIVYGTVESVSDDMSGDFVELKSPSMINGELNLNGVKCYFKNEDDVMKLSKGQTVYIKGLCDGMSMVNICFMDCKLVE